MKIKVTKSLTLLELLQKFDAEEVSEGRYFSESHPNRGVELACGVGVSFLNKGGYSTGYSSGYLDDFYEVEVEEDITEDTVFHKMIGIYDKSYVIIRNSARIKDFGGSTLKKLYALIDGELQLIWERDENE